ncbi:unnamed protein product [Dracunculus medinensis]|uniref:RNA-binding S4 domain-containing protein n=1 Tax=Dracunculus medinensis TaxID=318479 RepID=A0A3P7PQY8_DRAME|nr:unnamed protein product [Dracunculus medinensis]
MAVLLLTVVTRPLGRYKKKDPRKNDELQEDVDFDEIAETVDDGLPVDYKVKTIKAPNRRLETIVKRVAKKGNAMTDKLIFGGKVRLNEEDTNKKKSYNVEQSDIIDVWESAIEDNPSLSKVCRIEVQQYKLMQNGYDIQVKVWNDMIVDNWCHHL